MDDKPFDDPKEEEVAPTKKPTKTKMVEYVRKPNGLLERTEK